MVVWSPRFGRDLPGLPAALRADGLEVAHTLRRRCARSGSARLPPEARRPRLRRSTPAARRLDDRVQIYGWVTRGCGRRVEAAQDRDPVDHRAERHDLGRDRQQQPGRATRSCAGRGRRRARPPGRAPPPSTFAPVSPIIRCSCRSSPSNPQNAPITGAIAMPTASPPRDERDRDPRDEPDLDGAARARGRAGWRGSRPARSAPRRRAAAGPTRTERSRRARARPRHRRRS